MHKVSRRRLASTVVRLLREQPAEQQRIMSMLAAYVIAHKQQRRVDLLLKDIAQELAETDAHVFAEVASSFPLDGPARQDLVRYLQAQLHAQTVELDERVEPNLLAGVVVRTASHELDTSARTKLTRLQSLNVNRET